MAIMSVANKIIKFVELFPVINYFQLIGGVLSGGWATPFGQKECGETWDLFVKFSVARYKMAFP